MIVGLTGRIAAGKETLTSFLRERGFTYLETSKLLSEELTKRGLEITRTNQQNLGDEWRREHGPGALMKIFLERIDPKKDYIIDSLRNHHEVEFLKGCGVKCFVIAVDAPQRLRFERIIKRGKPSDPKTWEEFLVTDNRDFDSGDNMGQNVRKCMEMADFTIVNDDNLRDSMERIEKIWKQMTFERFEEIRVGSRYQHYRGNVYEVIGAGFDSETLEEVVIYRGQYVDEKLGQNPVFVRKKSEFLENVEIPRFKLVD